MSVKVTTRPKAGEEKVETVLTLNWDGMTTEDIKALAQQALIVKLQSQWRKDGIPAEANVNVVDHKVGTRAPKKSLAETISSMSAEDRKALLEKLQASLA